MNNRIFEVLNYIDIKNKISDYTLSELGKKLVDKLIPYTRYEVVERKLYDTTEAVNLIRAKGNIPLYGLSDIDIVIKKCEKGMLLHYQELLKISDFLRGCRRIRTFMMEEEFIAPHLCSYVYSMEEYPDLEEEINITIDAYGVKRDATTTLEKLNRQKIVVEENIESKLNNILKNKKYREYLQDFYTSRRKDRFVIPVKMSYKNMIHGKIIDQSSSGSTVFIEPSSIEKMTIKLDNIQSEIDSEIYQILYSLSGFVQMYIKGIKKNIEIMSEYDFVFAKAKYSLEIGGIKPKLTKEEYYKIVKGKHPLLGESAVPLDFEVGEQFRTLVITGPNTGGKTVVLKTVGLLSLMVQSGIHVPVDSNSVFPVFSKVLLDIGDNQDINQSLSTFSGHMKNIVEIINKANNSTLVLIDEIGTGTDPREGSALGMAVLEDIFQSGALTIVTTHYGELKDFGEMTPGFENARMIFDVDSLKPLYNLQIGESGKSNAFWIATEMGIKSKVINRAEELKTNKLNKSSIPINKNITFKEKKKKIEDARREYTPLNKGDLVLCLDTQQKSVVYEGADNKGIVTIYYNKEKKSIHRRRLKLLNRSTDLYPEGYNLDQIFIPWEKRKLEKDIKKGRYKNLDEINERMNK